MSHSRRGSLASCGSSSFFSSSSSSTGGDSSGRRRSAALQKLVHGEADPLMAMGSGGGEVDERTREASASSSRQARHRKGVSEQFQHKRSPSLSHKAFKVHGEALPSVSPSSPSYGANRSRLASADAALPRRRRPHETPGASPSSPSSHEASSLAPAAHKGNSSCDENMKEIARLKALLAQSQCELESTKTKLSKYSKENRSLRRRVEGYKVEVETKNERLFSLESDIEILKRGVTDAGQMEVANRRMEEEQLRLEGRRLREERDRAILERNELMSRVGMMGVEVDQPQPDDTNTDTEEGGDFLGAMNDSFSSKRTMRRRRSIEDLIHKMGGGVSKISMVGQHASLSGPDLMASMNASCGKMMVTPESLLWDDQ